MNRKIFFIFSLLSLFIIGNGVPTKINNRVARIDMNNYQRISFDSLVDNISCIKLEKPVFEYCINMISYKNYIYIMGSTIAGRSVAIYDKSGCFVKEITFPDAILVNSMCIVPNLEELWVVSRFKVINKFKLDGTPIRKVSLPFSCSAIIPMDKQDFLMYSGGANSDRGSIQGHFMALTDFKSIHKLFLPKCGKKELPSASYNLCTTDIDRCYIFPENIDTIYSCSFLKKEVKPLYWLNFHGDFLTKDRYPGGDHEMGEIIEKRMYIYAHYSFYQASGKLFFKLAGKREDFCMIRIKNNALYSFDRLFDNFKPNYINPFVGNDNNNLYLLTRKKELIEHYQNIKCTYPAIRKFLSSPSVYEDAWILVKIKIKV